MRNSRDTGIVKLMNPDNKTDMKDVCNHIQLAFSTYHMVT
jgi:hypothetical protein